MSNSISFRLDKLRRALSLVLCVLFALTQFPMPARADGGRLAAFNEELMDDQLNWGIAGGGSASSGSITLNPADTEPSEGRYEIDLTPLHDAVEAGGLRADISYSASPEGATVTFSAGGTSLSDGDVIPSGSTGVLVTVLNPTNETAEFTLSFAFNDTDVPVLSAEASPDTWTNGDVLITPAANDADSGIQRLFESDQTGAPAASLTDNGDGTYTATANGTYYFTAEDFAGHSTTTGCTVASIDKAEPSAPSISLSTEVEWATSAVTATITGAAAPEGESPQAVEYALNGGAFSAYTGMLTLSDEGVTQLSARVRDQAGNVSDTLEKTVRIDTQAPTISAAFGNTDADNNAALTFTAADSASGVLEKRYLEGERTTADYTSATILAGDTVVLAAGHSYTVFAKDNAGHVGTQTLYASSVPSLTLPGSFSINEGETKTLSFSVSDSETANGSLAVTVDSVDSAVLSTGAVQNSGGTATAPLTAADAIPAERTVNLSITVTDGDGQQSSGVLAVSLIPVNDAPQAVNDEAAVSEDEDVLIPALGNDTDEENDALSISAVGAPAHGSAVISGDSIRYTPSANYNGSDSFSYTVSDGDKTGTGVVTVTVGGVADAPVAVDGVLVIPEDTPVEIDLLDAKYVTDADLLTAQGDTLSITGIDTATCATVGTVTILNAEGNPVADGETGVAVRYESASEYSGTDKFRFTITDSYGLSSTATLSVKVSAVNDAPEYHSLDSLYEIDEDSGAYTISFSVSDQETPADSLMLQAASLHDGIIPETSLSLEKNEEGFVSLSFAPASNQNGNAVIKFTLGDGFQSVEKQVTIQVNPVNDMPVAVNDAISYTEDTACTIDPAVLLNNDSDIESGKPAFIAIEDWPESAGTLLQTGDTYLFTPASNYAQNFTFRYAVRDADGAEARATVTMRATAVNDTPTISTAVSSISIEEDAASAPISFTIHDQESAVDALTVTAGSDNNALISPDGIDLTTIGEERTITLTPNPDQFGTAAITLTVSDGLTSSTATIELTVSGVQDFPVAGNDTVAALRTGKTNFTASSLLANDSDLDGDTLTLTAYTQPAFGTLTLVNGAFSYQVNTDIPDTQATDSFQYTISDGHENTAVATVTISLTGESAAPLITSIADQYLLEDFAQTPVTFHVSDPDGTTPAVQVSASPEGVATTALTPGENGDYTLALTSILNQNGESQITVTATDGAGKTASVQFHLTVYPVNDAPVAGNVGLSVQEDIAKSFSLIELAGESIYDVENDALSVVSITPDSASTKAGCAVWVVEAISTTRTRTCATFRRPIPMWFRTARMKPPVRLPLPSRLSTTRHGSIRRYIRMFPM
jgi:VCBS repeat-containing protein